MSDEIIGYCFKCKEKHQILNPKAEWAANGSPGTRGTCANCGGTIYKAGRTPEHENLPKPAISTQKKSKKKPKKIKSRSPRRSGKLVVVESPAKARTIGRYLGYTIAHYADFYDLKHLLILGRVTSGKGGDLILNGANEVLENEFPELAAKMNIQLPDEKSRRVGQSIAAASLPALR